jgi:tetratricopeptide (TPR) repeat protein
VAEAKFGPDHPTTFTALTNLAMLYREAGKSNEAEPLLERIVAAEEKQGNVEDAELANSMNNLARMYREKGKYPESEALYKKSLNLREKAFGKESAEVAASLRNYSALLKMMGGRDNDADAMDKRASAIEDRLAASSP